MSAKKIHPSWLVAGACYGLTIGAFIGVRIRVPLGIEVLPFVILAGFYSFRRRSISSVIFIICAGVLVGLLRSGADSDQRRKFLQNFGEKVTLNGTVASDPSFGIEGETRFVMSDVSYGSANYTVNLWIEIPDRIVLKRSDRVEISGMVSSGFGPYAASIYHGKLLSVQHLKNADIAGSVRDSFANGIRNGIDEPEASLGAGFLLGQKTSLPEKLQNELRLLGLTHIVVASGYNLTVLIRFSRRLFMRISRFSALASSLFLVYLFMQMTGTSPSMSRAGLIATVSLIAWFYGRKIHPVVLIGISAGGTLFVNPSYAHNDLGWLLSFASFVGVLVLAPLIHAYFWGTQKPQWLRQLLVETASAQVCTVPIILLSFGTFSPLSIVANALVVPLIPVAMLLVFTAGIASLLVPFVSQIIAFPATLLLRYMTTIIDRLSVLPLANDSISFSLTAFITSYILIFISIIFLWRRSGHEFRDYNIIE